MKKFKKIISNRSFLFIFAFFIMLLSIIKYTDLFGGTVDATETWKVVKTFFANNRVYSYVMYKGIYAFIPGVISYNIGMLLHIDKFLVLKIINSLGFAYISTIGMPNLLKKLLNKEEFSALQYYIFILLFFILENNIFSFISVDYYSAILFIMLCNITIKLLSDVKSVNLLLFGLLVGLNLSLSGQYSLATYLILVFIVIKMISRYLNIINKKSIINLMLCFGIIIGGYTITTMPNAIYEEYVVNYGRNNGEWIPKGSDWIKTGMTRDMQIINYPALIPDNIGYSIMMNRGDDIESAKMGIDIYEYKDYIKIFIRYPFEFSTRIFEREFLGITNDYKNMRPLTSIHFNTILNLIIMCTCLYISMILIKNRVKRVKDILNYKSIIICSSILTTLPPSLLHVENRYYIYLRTLIIGATIFNLSFNIKKINFKNLKDMKINYNIISYIIFMILCIALYLAIYQSKVGKAIL